MSDSDISDVVREQARQWLVRLHSGAATQADAQAFRQWLAGDSSHGRAWRQLNVSMHALDPVMQEARHLHDGWQERAAAARARRQVTRRAFIGGALSASVVGAMAWRPPLGLWPSVTELAADFRTGVGELREIQVGQAVAVQMGAQTRINRQSDAGGAGMELVAGEAEFRVGRHEDSGWWVKAGPGRVWAQLALFNLRYTGFRVAVTCLQGRVRVESGQAFDLREGQQLVYDAHRAQIMAHVDLAKVSAWRNGHLIFAGAPLDEVVSEINRYRPGRILVYGDELKQRPVHLNLAISDMDQALDVLRSLSGIRVQELAGGVALLRQV